MERRTLYWPIIFNFLVILPLIIIYKGLFMALNRKFCQIRNCASSWKVGGGESEPELIEKKALPLIFFSPLSIKHKLKITTNVFRYKFMSDLDPGPNPWKNEWKTIFQIINFKMIDGSFCFCKKSGCLEMVYSFDGCNISTKFSELFNYFTLYKLFR